MTDREALNTVEEWVLRNNTSDIHPFHIHVNNFQLTAINGVPQDTGTLQDTVNIPAGTFDPTGTILIQAGTVTIRMEFTDFLGKYVFHCHRLDHEDLGMMAIVDVVP